MQANKRIKATRNKLLKLVTILLFYFIFFSDFALLFYSVFKKNNAIGFDDFLLVFLVFFLFSLYLLFINISKTLREKVFRVSSILVTNKEGMFNNFNLTVKIVTVIFVIVFVSFFIFSVLPTIFYNYL